MPEMDGLSLLEIVRGRWPSVRRVLVSGSGADEIRPRPGVLDEFVAKPFVLREMLEALAIEALSDRGPVSALGMHDP